MAGGRLGTDRHDDPRLGVGRHLGTVDEVRSVAGLVAQAGVSVGARDDGLILGAAPGRRSRARGG